MNDLDFVQRCVKGDKQAWAEFISRYSRLIYGCIHKSLMVYGRAQSDKDTAAELFQETFASLIKDNYKKLRSFKARNGSSLAGWLKQVAVNLTVDCLRKRRPAVSLDEEGADGLSLKEKLADGSVPVDEQACGHEQLEQLAQCIQELDTDDKFFLELHLNRGLGLEELKDILGISRPAADMRKSRIISRLRECFKSKGFALDSRV